MTDQSGDATLQSKHNFEHICSTRGVKVKACHADNGRFAEHSFLGDCKRCLQRLTFCGIGAHHQDGVSENAIKQLTLTARTLLVHAQSHWPEYITTMLWPFAIKAARDRMNELNFGIDGKTPDMRFSGVGVKSLRLRDFHTFGCPCYVLDSRLQTDPKCVPKWEPRARVGGWRVKPSFFCWLSHKLVLMFLCAWSYLLAWRFQVLHIKGSMFFF